MSRHAKYKFLLYIADDAPNSLQAISNLNTLCREHLPDLHEIEVIDVFKEPKRALTDGIFMTPTLIKLTPLPVRKIVGTLSQTKTMSQALGLDDTVA